MNAFFSSRRRWPTWEKNGLASQICVFSPQNWYPTFGVPKICCSNLNLPNFRCIIKTQAVRVFLVVMEDGFKIALVRKTTNLVGKPKSCQKTATPSAPFFHSKNTSPKHKLWIFTATRDIWHHNINLLAPHVIVYSVCSVVGVLLRCLKLFFHILTSNAPVMKREEPNLYQGKGR